MKTLHRLGSAAVLAASLAVGACGSSDSGSSGAVSSPPAPVGATLPAAGTPVPAGAGVSVAAFISFLQGLNGTDETSEPFSIPDSFAVPDDEANDSAALS